MTDAEMAFLAQLAIGVFSIDQQGQIWRHRFLKAGSKIGTPPVERDMPKRRAETTATKDHLRVQLQVRGEKIMVYAHRLVWMVANQSDISTGLEINHKDGNPTNNNPANLELVTHRGNAIHAMRVLGKMKREGVHNASAKLTEDQAREIRYLAENNILPQRLIGLQFGVRTKTVQDILYRSTWKHLI